MSAFGRAKSKIDPSARLLVALRVEEEHAPVAASRAAGCRVSYPARSAARTSRQFPRFGRVDEPRRARAVPARAASVSRARPTGTGADGRSRPWRAVGGSMPVLSRGSLQTRAGGVAGARLARERQHADDEGCHARCASTSPRHHPRPEILDDARDDGIEVGSSACEVKGARGEDACPRRALVVRHLRRRAGPEQVRDLRQHLDSARRAGRDPVDLDAAAGERRPVLQAGPGEDPRARRPRVGRSTAAAAPCRSRGTGRR